MAAKQVVKLKSGEIAALTKLCVFTKVCFVAAEGSKAAYWRLAELKLATRTVHAAAKSDRRQVCFKITPAGKKALQHCLAKRK